MMHKIHSAAGWLWSSFQGRYDAYNLATPYGAATVAVALLTLHCMALAARVPFVDISSVHAMLTGAFLSVMVMMESRHGLGSVLSAVMALTLSAAMALMMGAATWDWMVAQSDVQTAFDIRTTVMQIMLVSGYIGVFCYLNRAVFMRSQEIQTISKE